MLGLRPNLWKDHPAVVFLFSTLEAEQNPHWWILIDAWLVENRKDWRDDIAVVLNTMVHRCISAWISCFTLHKKAQQLHTLKRSTYNYIYLVKILKSLYVWLNFLLNHLPSDFWIFGTLQLATSAMHEVYLLPAMFWCYRHCYGAPGIWCGLLVMSHGFGCWVDDKVLGFFVGSCEGVQYRTCIHIYELMN